MPVPVHGHGPVVHFPVEHMPRNLAVVVAEGHQQVETSIFDIHHRMIFAVLDYMGLNL